MAIALYDALTLLGSEPALSMGARSRAAGEASSPDMNTAPIFRSIASIVDSTDILCSLGRPQAQSHHVTDTVNSFGAGVCTSRPPTIQQEKSLTLLQS